jgi:hypothetical protein
MAYEEPGVKVIQQLVLDAANIAAATQALTLVGELYEVFDDEVHTLNYDALTGAGDQEFAWPGKKASSVVDLAGVRKSIAEVDSQLNEFAPYPLQWRLRDPSTSALFDVDALTDVFALNQTRFKIIEGSEAATARAAAATGTGAQNRQLHIEAGGLISAGVVAGDRVRVTNGSFDVRGTVDTVFDDTAFFTPDGHDLTLNALTAPGATSIVADVPAGEGVSLDAAGVLALGSGATMEWVEYSSVVAVGDTHTFDITATPTVHSHAAGDAVKVVVRDTPSASDDDGDLQTAPGFLNSAAVDSSMVGARVALWVEQEQVNDGAAAGATNVLQLGSLDLDETAVGKKVTIWSEDAGDGAVAITDCDVADQGGGQGVNVVSNTPATPFLATMVGDAIKVNGEYRRISEFVSTSEVKVDTAVTAGTTLAATVYGQVVRTILAIDGSNAEVDGVALTAGTLLPLVLHRAVYRNLVTDPLNVDNVSVRYSGSAVSSDTGNVLQVPFEVFDADLTYEVFPNYELLCSFRALDLSSTNQELAIYAASDLTALGGVSPANPIAWAAQAALVAMGTTDELIIAQPVDLFPDDDPGLKSGYPEDKDEVLGYLLALEILARNEAVYYMVPLTQNSTVRDSFVSHCLAMSAPEEKKERICYLSYKLPLGDVESTTGEVAPGLEGGNKAIVDAGQNFLSQHNVIPGNIVKITAPASIAGEYEIANGSTEDRLELEGADWEQTLEMTQATGNFGGQQAVVDTFTEAAGVVTMATTGTGANLFTASDIGRTIVVAGATTPGNDGAFVITGVPNANEVEYANASGATEAGGTAISTVTPDNEMGSNVANAFKDAEIGDYLVVGSVFRLITGIKSDGLNLYGRLEYDGAPLTLGSAQSVSVLRTSIAVNYHVRPLNKTDQASTLAGIGQARGNRRVVHMWPDEVEMITGTDAFGNDVKEMLPSIYSAAAEAGRDSVIPEARSSTGLSLGGFTALNHSNFYFSKSQLNTIAGGGWAILEQRVQGAPVQMRHLLTTDMSSVKTQEVSFTKNVDNMAKVKRASVEPLLNDELGRINITQDFLTSLAFPFQGIFENFVAKGQLVKTADADPYKILSIRQDPTQPDTILEDVELNVPLPANRVVVTFII